MYCTKVDRVNNKMIFLYIFPTTQIIQRNIKTYQNMCKILIKINVNTIIVYKKQILSLNITN